MEPIDVLPAGLTAAGDLTSAPDYGGREAARAAATVPPLPQIAERISGFQPGLRSATTMFGALSGGGGGSRGDHDLNPGLEPRRPLRRAAVLVGLVERAPGYAVLLTRRTDTLAHHAGQISFPGGRIEAEDSDPEAAALREAEEEVALPRRDVRPLGRLDTYITRTGFEIVPVVATITPGAALCPDPIEVAEIFEVPLAFVLDRGNHVRGSRVFDGQERFFWELRFDRHRIWGATAGMLVNLAEVLSPSVSGLPGFGPPRPTD